MNFYNKGLSKIDVIRGIINNRSFVIKEQSSMCFAPINIALIKYWGKKDDELNLAMSPSLSISSQRLGTWTQVLKSNQDEMILNDKINQDNECHRAFDFVNLLRKVLGIDVKLKIITKNNIPISSGLASSASGFACLSKALNDLLNLNLSQQELSMLARFGSGSACRSVLDNCRFVIWNGDFAEPCVFNAVMKRIVDNMQILVLIVDEGVKQKSSREAMRLTTDAWRAGRNIVYNHWLQQTNDDFNKIFLAKNWPEFGSIVERNALIMHKAIRASGINYFTQNTMEVIKFVKQCRENNLMVYLTIDAGANVKILYQRQDYEFLKNKVQHYLIDNGVCLKALDF